MNEGNANVRAQRILTVSPPHSLLVDSCHHTANRPFPDITWASLPFQYHPNFRLLLDILMRFPSVLPPIPREYVHTVSSSAILFSPFSWTLLGSRWEQWQLVSLHPLISFIRPNNTTEKNLDASSNLSRYHQTQVKMQSSYMELVGFPKGKRCAQLHTSDRCLASFRLKYKGDGSWQPSFIFWHSFSFQRTDIQPKELTDKTEIT